MNLPEYFFVKKGNRYVKVKFCNILYLRAFKNYVNIVTENGSYLALISLARMEKVLEVRPHSFCRIHHSYIISLAHADSFDNEAVLIKGTPIPIGNHYWNRLKEYANTLVRDNRNNRAGRIIGEYLVTES